MKKHLYVFVLCAAVLLLNSCKKNEDSTEAQPNQLAGNEVLMVVTSNATLKDGSSAGYYLPEAIDFYRELTKAGYQVTIASPKGGKAPMYDRNYHVQYYRSQLDSLKLLDKLDSTVALSAIDAGKFKGVFYVGGFACLFDFPDNTSIKQITRYLFEHNGTVAAVCHGPSALLNVTLSNGDTLIKGKRITGRSFEEDRGGSPQVTREVILNYFPMILEDELRNRSNLYTNTTAFQKWVVTDGRLITGQNPESSTEVARKAIALMQQP